MKTKSFKSVEPNSYGSTFLFYGLLLYTFIHYSQIAGRYPILAPFRVEFVVGAILLINISLKIVSQDIAISENKVNYASLVFFCYCGLTIPFSYVISRAIEQYIQFFKFFSIYLMIISCINNEKRIKVFFMVLLAMTALIFVEPFFLSLQGKGYRYANYMMRLYGVTGFFAHPNQLGGIAAANLPFFYYMIFYYKSPLIKVFFIALVFIAIRVVMLTQSRTAFIGVFAFLVFAFLMSKHKVKMLVVLLLCSFMMYPFIPEETRNRFFTLKQSVDVLSADESKYVGDHEVGSMNSRWILVKRSFTVFIENPIIGVGMDCYPSVSGRKWNSWMLTHNLYTQALAELGIVGFLLFIYLLYQIYRNIRSADNLMQSRNDRSILYFINNAQLMFLSIRLVIGLFGHDLYRNWWWISAGLSVVSIRILKEKYGAEIPEIKK